MHLKFQTISLKNVFKTQEIVVSLIRKMHTLTFTFTLPR